MIYDNLYSWQKTIVDNIKDKDNYGIFLDMGCGKTPISLALSEINDCNKIIIISINAKALETNLISGSFLNWADKMKLKYNYYNKNFCFDGSGNKKYNAVITPKTNDILIVNYESLYERLENKKSAIQLKKQILDFIKSCDGCNVSILIDESHKIKDLSSKQTKAIFKIKQLLELRCKNLHCYLLTGTPFTVNYLDLYSQLKFLGCPINKTQFLENFCVRANFPSLLPWQQPIKSFKNVDQLLELVHQYAITIKSEEVCKNLPEKIFVDHVMNKTKIMDLFLKEKEKPSIINEELKRRNLIDLSIHNVSDKKINNPFFRNINYPDFNWVADTPSLLWMRARQLSIGFQGNEENCEWFDRSRLDAVKKLLEENEDNYILFYNFTPEFVELYDICESLGYKIDVYNGLIKSEIYYNEYSNLSEGEKLTQKKRIIISNFSSGSTGKNWQEYHNCIIFSIPLFDDWTQGIKRIHRTGQKSNCIYHVFSQDNWLDKSMLKSLNERVQYDEKLFEKELDEFNKNN